MTLQIDILQPTIREALNYTPTNAWVGVIDPEVLALPPRSGCGRDVLELIVAGETLIARIHDTNPAIDVAGIRQAVAAAVAVLFFG